MIMILVCYVCDVFLRMRALCTFTVPVQLYGMHGRTRYARSCREISLRFSWKLRNFLLLDSVRAIMQIPYSEQI
jgi:hypothetical protein